MGLPDGQISFKIGLAI